MRLALVVLGLAACGRISLDEDALRDPATCASCHPAQYAEWAGSMHAYASDDPVFRGLVRLGQRQTSGGLGTLCVGCHAPAAVATGATVDGTDLDQVPRAAQGVGCWACHAIDGVTALHNGGLSRADDGVMRGGHDDPLPTPAHDSTRSELLAASGARSSEACGACHDVQVGAVAVESTYAEWSGSVFGAAGAAPLSCAGCHMFGSDGPAAAVADAPIRRRRDHRLAGVDQALIPWPDRDAQGAAIDRDLGAALLATLCVTPATGGAEAQVTLDNIQAGHAFPSGVTHARRVWVELVASTAGTPTYTSGRFADDQPVSRAADPDLWLMTSTLRGADGEEVTHAWEVASIEPALLSPAVTTDPQDPRFYHAQSHTYPLAGAPDTVEIAIHVEAIGRDLIDELIAAGELAPELRDRVPRRTIARRTWRRAAGYGCAR